MDKVIKVENILSQISKLDYESRLYLMERLVRLVRKQGKEKKSGTAHLTELSNLGAEIWQNVNIDKYVQEERQWD